MLFTSCVFLFAFLPFVLLVYFLLRNTTASNFFLMLASIFFYAWGEVEWCWVMLVVIAVNYVAAMLIEDRQSVGQRKILLGLTIAADLCVLAWFKYAGFLEQNVNFLFKAIQAPQLVFGDVHLPLGISFFVFHSLSYVVDVFRGVAKAQRNPFNMALYISLFPQLVAGPIVRYHDICDQLTERTHSIDKAAEGVRRFVTGLAKKMLIANALAVPADQIFGLPGNELSTSVAWLGAICYTFQIYFDFSGYSDMAIGLGLLFGFRLPENFNYPYIAKSMREFWQRWHISLSNWFRDYLYIPLGGNRVPEWRVCVNLMTVFFLCGLWHGASWQFVAWGIYHGFFLGIERAFAGKYIDKWPSIVRHSYVMFFVVLSWVLFRAHDFAQAADFYKAMFGFGSQSGLYPAEMYLNNEVVFLLVVASIAATPVRQLIIRLSEGGTTILTQNRMYTLRTAWCLVALFLCVTEIAAGTYNPFIYFRF